MPSLLPSFSQLLANVVALLVLSTAVAASPIALNKRWMPLLHCKNPIVRKEWSSLNNNQKAAYINAVKCLAQKPSISGFPAALSRFDDFVAVHNHQTPHIHWVGHFLHWHRYMLWEYEKSLRTLCGYTGAQPYWDTIRDAQTGLNLTDYDIMSNTTGFGGNGAYVPVPPEQNWLGLQDRSGGGCVVDGPFREGQFNVSVYTNDLYNVTGPRCLKRDFCPTTFKEQNHPSVVTELNQKTTFTEFARRMEALPGWSQLNVHGAGHFGVGGLLGNMGDAFNSPGDPLFYMHHANIDRIWTEWQGINITRILDVGGPRVAFDYNYVQAPEVDLLMKINLGNIAGNATIAELVYTRGPKMCYIYQ